MSLAALQLSENGKIHFETRLCIPCLFKHARPTDALLGLDRLGVRSLGCMPIHFSEQWKHQLEHQGDHLLTFCTPTDQHSGVQFAAQCQHGLVALAQQCLEQQIGHPFELAQ